MPKVKKLHAMQGRPFQSRIVERRGFRPAYDLSDLAWAYREAARLINRTAPAEVTAIDSLPVIYLYRHSLECAIKSTLLVMADEIGTPRTEITTGRSHDLRKQINDLKACAKLARFKLKQRTVDVINRVGQEDPSGTAYRYDPYIGDYDVKRFVEELEVALANLEDFYREVSSHVNSAIVRSLL